MLEILGIVQEYTVRISSCCQLVIHFEYHLKYISLTLSFLFIFTGLSDVPGEAMVKLYCPKCMDVYTPKSSRHHHTDGAYFGTGFPHMLFMVHPEYRPKKPTNQFVPRLYGFKIHPLAYQIQQQGASNFKVPMRTVSYNNGRKWSWNFLIRHLFIQCYH